ncbi:type I secretion system permease/ATPase [Aureimonas mangrovi]|uniref:type I secretion system permease/ATPase n=1 Tax=Aureimonas mangrovi TaxID=2758041 RepID=UPI00163D4BBC|nr:type I secretion system permease/ATPase [Aureimonas mangrovi]
MKKKPIDEIAKIAWSGASGLFFFTFVTNVLLLVQPLYMLQVYDRVLVSSSLETLAFISLIAAGAILLLGAIDALRSIMAGRLAARIGVAGGSSALLASIAGQRASLGDIQPLRDLSTVRGFVGGRTLLAFLDMPFAPFFIGILYLIHPHLFWLTAGGAVVLFAVAFANQWAGDRALGASGEESIGASLMAQAFTRNGESISAMGMRGNVTEAWGRQEGRAMAAQERANSVASFYGGLSRVVRLGLQIAILGYGGYLVVTGEMTAGMIFAASLISGRGLQPIDQVIGGWKGFVDFRAAWRRLSAALASAKVGETRTELPTPTGRIEVQKVIVAARGNERGDPILKGVSAVIPQGACVAVVGASGAGKSTLARVLAGALVPNSGVVRIDGADMANWDSEALGRHVGYLSQEVEMLPGTIAQNIARFDPDASDADIVAAATKAQVHDLVLGFPQGYDTMLGPGGIQLSGGQRQRVGLARAFFGTPRLLVLDEPNANLDMAGEQALDRALAAAKADGTTVIVVTQRRQVADVADRILMMRDGAIEDYGTRAEVLERQAQRVRQAQEAAAANAGGQVRPPQPLVGGRFTSVVSGGAAS